MGEDAKDQSKQHFWSEADYDNGGHLTPDGGRKAAALILAFFKTSPHARCWFVTGETC